MLELLKSGTDDILIGSTGEEDCDPNTHALFIIRGLNTLRVLRVNIEGMIYEETE
jgi:hypothetical protein